MADDLVGRILKVVDGDTLIMEADGQHRTLHLMGVDAPERVQDFGAESRGSLAAMTFNREARAECAPSDRGGRIHCRVWVQPADCPRCGQTLDLGHAQLLAGMAWRLTDTTAYADADMQGRYQSAELTAQMRRMGLWAQRYPTPPWAWRQRWGMRDE
jgi:endonuclease YncB( thermonuclease family)